jgi:hypothetical protein
MTNQPITNNALTGILATFAEQDRLRKLSNEDLVRECPSIPDTDCAVVDEMMTRLWPEWSEEEDGE